MHLMTAWILASYSLCQKYISSASASFQNHLRKSEMQAVFHSTDGISRSTALQKNARTQKIIKNSISKRVAEKIAVLLDE